MEATGVNKLLRETITPSEVEGVVEAFLAEHKDVVLKKDYYVHDEIPTVEFARSTGSNKVCLACGVGVACIALLGKVEAREVCSGHYATDDSRFHLYKKLQERLPGLNKSFWAGLEGAFEDDFDAEATARYDGHEVDKRAFEAGQLLGERLRDQAVRSTKGIVEPGSF